MRSDIKLLSSGVAAALLLAIGVAGAQARRFELSSQTIRAVWTRLRFEDFSGGTIGCPVTLEGSFHSKTLSKVSGELIGYITRANTVKGAINCEGGFGALFLTSEEGFPTTLPWHLLYDSFEGALPRIVGITVQIIGWSIRYRRSVTERCLYKSTEIQPAVFIFRMNAGVVTELTANENFSIPWNSEGELICSRRGRYLPTPNATVTPLERVTSAITVRLVQ